MTQFTQLVRGADALLAANVELRAAASAGSRRAIFGGSRTTAAEHLAHVDTLLARAAELVQPHRAATSEAIGQARQAVAELAGDAMPSRTSFRSAIEPHATRLEALHRDVLTLLDDAPPLQDPHAAATWNRAAALVRDGIELPASLRESGRAVVDSAPLVDPVARLGVALRSPVDDLRARDMYEVARIIRALGDARPAAISSLTERTATELEHAARLVDRGIELPAGWSTRGVLEQARARTLWSDADAALTRVREIVWSREGPTRATDLADLRTLRNAPVELRLPQLDVLAADMPLTPLDQQTLRALRAATAGDAVRAEVAGELLEATTALADMLPRQNITAPLQTIRDRLARFGGLPLPEAERRLVDDTLQLIDRTIARRDGYGGWRELGDVGRVTANTELLARLEGSRTTPVVDDVQAAAAASGEDVGAGMADDAAAETLTW